MDHISSINGNNDDDDDDDDDVDDDSQLYEFGDIHFSLKYNKMWRNNVTKMIIKCHLF